MPFIPAIIGAVGAIGGALIGSHGANKAASTQANAADYAANLQKQEADASLAFQKQQYGDTQANMAPYIHAGQGAVSTLAELMGISPASNPTATPSTAQSVFMRDPTSGRLIPTRAGGGRMLAGDSNDPTNNVRFANENGVPTIANRTVPASAVFGGPAGARPSNPDFGSLTKGWNEQFTAPTDVTEQNDPGYKFRLSQGLEALQNSAAARGNLLSGNTAKAINDYAQNDASAEYSNVYGRSMNEYLTRFNTFKQNQSDLFNRYASIAGLGQTSTAQLGQLGQSAATNIGDINIKSGAQIGNNINNAAYQRGSGYAANANIWGGALNTGMLSLAQIMQQLQKQQQSSGTDGGTGSWSGVNS